MKRLLKSILKIVVPAPARLAIRKARARLDVKRQVIATYPALRSQPLRALRYILTDPEIDNFTYDLANVDDLAAWIGQAFGLLASDVLPYIREIEADTELHGELSKALGRRVKFGRRVGWYCAVRIQRPELVVETGVHDGIGSSVLLRALERNGTGRLIGIDINPDAGWVVPDSLRNRFTFVANDSLAALREIAATETIDFFLHDSDHSREHEVAEFSIVENAMAPGFVTISDNSHVTDALEELARRHAMPFHFWREKPKNHFYPGAGIGLARKP